MPGVIPRAAVGPLSGQPFDVTPDEARRFWHRVKRGAPNECWEWTGPMTRTGYGNATVPSFRPGPVNAHRVAYRIARGPIPRGMSVLHGCDNPSCVNPDHLRVGTHAENMRDMQVRGRHYQARKSTCKRGHGFAGENVVRDAAGRRHCVSCARDQKLRSQRAKAEPLRVACEGELRASVARIAPPTLAELVSLIGERDAEVVADACGLYDRPVLSLTQVGDALGVTRERARQLRNRGLERMGADVRTIATAHRHVALRGPRLAVA